jgi:hypothetical protein
MGEHNGKTQRMIELIRERGTVTSIDLRDIAGVPLKQQLDLLRRLLDAGTITTELVDAPVGHCRRKVRSYTWQGEAAVAPSPSFRKPKTAQSAGMRRCLGGCGQMFHSTHAGNRICDRCKGIVAKSSAAGIFDQPAVIRYR